MTNSQLGLIQVAGLLLVLVAAIIFVASPPAITMYQNNGFFWWGFLPGLILGAGFLAIIIPLIYKN